MCSVESKSGCYLLQKSVDTALNNNRYKIGKSKNVKTRLNSSEYANAKLISICYLSNINKCEKEIISSFDKQFRRIINATDVNDIGSYGLEVFEGNKDELCKTFKNICDKYVMTDHMLTDTNTITSTIEPIVFDTTWCTTAYSIVGLNIDILMLDNDTEDLKFEHEGLSIEQNSYEKGLFYLQSLENTIKRILNREVILCRYMQSYMFYATLACYDKSLELYPNVYLLMCNNDNSFSIGTNFDVDCTQLDNTVIISRIVPVKDVSVSNVLIDYFKRNFETAAVDGWFKYTNFDSVITRFNDIVSKHASIEMFDYKSSDLIQTKPISRQRQGMRVSKEVCMIIVKHFVNDPHIVEAFDEMFRLIELSYKDESYTSYVYNKALSTKCVYWKFHKYTVIQNESDGYVNGSRLFNSIKKADEKSTQQNLKKYLDSHAIQRLKGQFKAKYGTDQLYYFHDNAEQPYLKGYYVHYILVHYIVDWLSAEYSFMVAELMFNMFRNGQTNLPSISGGGSKDEYVKRYMSYKCSNMDLNALCNLLEV